MAKTRVTNEGLVIVEGEQPRRPLKEAGLRGGETPSREMGRKGGERGWQEKGMKGGEEPCERNFDFNKRQSIGDLTCGRITKK